jgi:hypothetical protein
MPAKFSHDRQQSRTFRDYGASRLRWYGRGVPGHRHEARLKCCYQSPAGSVHTRHTSNNLSCPQSFAHQSNDLHCIREETASRQSQASCGFQPKGRLFTICCASRSTSVVAAHRANDRARCFRKTRESLFFWKRKNRVDVMNAFS